MVRFSDMLGGSGEPDDVHAANSPYAALAGDLAPADAIPEPDDEPEAEVVEPEPEPEPALETPEDVLNRLTQYATSARALDTVVKESTPAPTAERARDEPTPDEVQPSADDPLSPVAGRDDLLPRAKGPVRRAGRGRKRHP